MSRAYTLFYEDIGLAAVLGVGKWSCMSAFLFLESLTIVSSPLLTFQLSEGEECWKCSEIMRPEILM